jgi:hypothetical protein
LREPCTKCQTETLPRIFRSGQPVFIAMIVFNLSCNNDHRFEGWFESSAIFESQRDARLVSCPVCGTDQISKELHAPYVNTGAGRGAENPGMAAAPVQRLAVMHKAVAHFVEHVIANTEDVGDAFPEEARKIHYREAPERAIRGNATGDEIAELQDEGIEVLAIPIPKSRTSDSH